MQKKNILHVAGRVVQKENHTYEFDNVYICYAWIYDAFILTHVCYYGAHIYDKCICSILIYDFCIFDVCIYEVYWYDAWMILISMIICACVYGAQCALHIPMIHVFIMHVSMMLMSMVHVPMILNLWHMWLHGYMYHTITYIMHHRRKGWKGGVGQLCVGHTAWAPEGREGRSEEARRASN